MSTSETRLPALGPFTLPRGRFREKMHKAQSANIKTIGTRQMSANTPITIAAQKSTQIPKQKKLYMPKSSYYLPDSVSLSIKSEFLVTQLEDGNEAAISDALDKALPNKSSVRYLCRLRLGC